MSGATRKIYNTNGKLIAVEYLTDAEMEERRRRYDKQVWQRRRGLLLAILLAIPIFYIIIAPLLALLFV